MQPAKRSLNINGSGAGSSYWSGKPPKKQKNLEKINEDFDKQESVKPETKLKSHGSSKSEENNFSKFKLNTLDENRKVKFAIGSSRSDEHDLTKSYLVKEKELQDKKRQKDLIFQKKQQVRNFLNDDDSNQSELKPPLPSKDLTIRPPLKLFEKPMNLPINISNQTYRADQPSEKTSKSLDDNLSKEETRDKKIDSLTYRVDESNKKQAAKIDTEKLDNDTINSKQVKQTNNKNKPKISSFSNEPRQAKTYQSIHSKNKNTTQQVNKTEEESINILPLEENELVETSKESLNKPIYETNTDLIKKDNIQLVEQQQQINISNENKIHRVKSSDGIEPLNDTNNVNKNESKQFKKVATPNQKKMKLFEAKKTNTLNNKPSEKTTNSNKQQQIDSTEDKNVNQSNNTNNKAISIQPNEVVDHKLDNIEPIESVQPLEIVTNNDIKSKIGKMNQGTEPLKDADLLVEPKPNQIRMKKVATPKSRPTESNKNIKPIVTSQDIPIAKQINNPILIPITSQDVTQPNVPNDSNIASLFRADIKNKEIPNESVQQQEQQQQLKVNPSIKSNKSAKRNIITPNVEIKKVETIKQDQSIRKIDSIKNGNKIADIQIIKTIPSTRRINKQLADTVIPDNADFAYKKLANETTPETNATILNMKPIEESLINNKLKPRSDSIYQLVSKESPSMTPIENHKELTIIVIANEDTQPINEPIVNHLDEDNKQEENEQTETKKNVEKIKEIKPKIPKELDIKHIKLMYIFSIVLAIMFPFTGLFSLYYAHKTRKNFELKDSESTRKSLEKTEWFLIASLFLGLLFFISLFMLLALFLKWVNLF